ncbi:MAG: FtsX-like permease family protein [Bacteroidia bacterium]|nr:FtsX-like permease family protein [Bacteroidia bacterium]
MFFNYLKTSIRNLLRYKGYTLINIVGMTLGLASSILILLFVLDELSYDKFNNDYDRIYRVSVQAKVQGPEIRVAVSCVPIGPTLVKELPGVEQYTRLFPFGGDPLVRYEDKSFVEDGFVFADSTFFDVFTTRFIAGNAGKGLNRPNTLVITRSIAMKYFGSTDVIGKTLQVFDPPQQFAVDGVIEDFPLNSHIRFSILASFASSPLSRNTIWVSNNLYTYIKISKSTNAKDVESGMVAIVDKYVGPQLKQFLGFDISQMRAAGNRYGYVLTPITDIHLNSDLDFEFRPNGSMSTIYIFSLIALFLIIIAAINFMNMATARASSRAREVGIRKVVGSQRSDLVGQFLTESSLLTLISFILGILIVFLALPYFNDIANKDLSIKLINWGIFIPSLVILLIFISLASGSYPSFYLASFNPVSVLKGKLQMGIRGGWLRKSLVIIQFFITIGLVVSTLVISKQNHFILNKDLNFDKENLLIVNRAYALGGQSQVFIDRIKAIPGIMDATITTQVPGGRSPGNTVFRREGDGSDGLQSFNIMATDQSFQKTMKIEMVQGRYFSKEFGADSSAMVINEVAAKRLQWDQAVDKILYVVAGNPTGGDLPMNVIGVIKDYNYESLHQEVKPLVITPTQVGAFSVIRYSGIQETELISKIKTVWSEVVPNQPFNYTFMNDQLLENYQKDRQMGKIFTIFAILAIIVACLGLLGLSSFTIEKRKKEISIRKCLGAPSASIMEMLLKETVLLVIIATLIASPLSWKLMSRWLQNFNYQINIGIGIFLIATLIALIIAVATILLHVYKASVRNPAEALKMD